MKARSINASSNTFVLCLVGEGTAGAVACRCIAAGFARSNGLGFGFGLGNRFGGSLDGDGANVDGIVGLFI